MVADFHPPKPFPADPLGQRLHELFGRNLWDFIEAPTPAPGEKPTVAHRHHYQMRPRILWQRWQDPDTLIGVRFESQTLYALIDIDAESPYCNVEAIAQLRAALETIGITRTLLLRSSHSNGLHLYLPLPEPCQNLRPGRRDRRVFDHSGLQNCQRHPGDLPQPQALRRREDHPLQRPPTASTTRHRLLFARRRPESHWRQARSLLLALGWSRQPSGHGRAAPRPQNRTGQPPQKAEAIALSQQQHRRTLATRLRNRT
jgi:hypothetical protein